MGSSPETLKYADYVQSEYNMALSEKERRLLNTGLFEITKSSTFDHKLELKCKCCNKVYDFRAFPSNGSEHLNTRFSTHFRESSQNLGCIEKLKGKDHELAESYLKRWKKRNAFLNPTPENPSQKTEITTSNTESSDTIKDFFRFAVRCDSPYAFPQASGIYLVLLEIESTQIILYVGRSVNLKARWFNHHRAQQLDMLTNIFGDCLSYYALFASSLFTFNENQLAEMEARLISECKPKLNGTTTNILSPY